MEFDDIVRYWSQQTRNTENQWIHPEDDQIFRVNTHSFNLDFPVSPYIGDILSAPVIILGANAGYDPMLTPSEFPDKEAVDAYIERVRMPSSSDWSFVSKYYHGVNYGHLLAQGKAALINASPYRSRKISEEPENKKLIRNLPSTKFNRQWLLEALIPLAESGRKLVIAKRPGLWNLPPEIREKKVVVFDPAPVSPNITSNPFSKIKNWLQ